jgi:hypothetical protein
MSQARLLLSCVCLFGAGVAGAGVHGICYCAKMLPESLADTTAGKPPCTVASRSSPLEPAGVEENGELTGARFNRRHRTSVRRHRTIVQRHLAMEIAFGGSQLAFLAEPPADIAPPRGFGPSTASLKPLHVRLQI